MAGMSFQIISYAILYFLLFDAEQGADAAAEAGLL